jgi:hypothetical protein
MNLFVDHAGNPVTPEDFDKIPFGNHIPSAFEDDEAEPVEKPKLKRTYSFVGGLSSAVAHDPISKPHKSWDDWDTVTDTRAQKDPRPKKTVRFSEVSTFHTIDIVNTRRRLEDDGTFFTSPVMETKTGEKIVLSKPPFPEKCVSGDRAEDS